MDCDLRMTVVGARSTKEVAGARLTKEMKGEIFGFGCGRSSMDEGNRKYLVRKTASFFALVKRSVSFLGFDLGYVVFSSKYMHGDKDIERDSQIMQVIFIFF